MRSDTQLIHEFRCRNDIPADFSADELGRILWLAASGAIYLPQSLGEDIDAEIRHRAIAEKLGPNYCRDCLEHFEFCKCHWGGE